MSFAEVANTSTLPPFSDKKVLAKDKTRFCVTAVREVEKDGRTSWYLDILKPNGTEQVAETVTFGQGSAARDKKLKEMQNDLLNADVVHGVWLDPVKMKTGSTYYDPRHDAEFVCLCAQTADDEGDPF